MVQNGFQVLLMVSFFGLGFGALPLLSSAQEQGQMSRAKISEALAPYRAKGMIREMKFIPIPAGKFVMGCNPKTEENCNDGGTPAHPVTLSAFEMQETEVTQAHWLEVMGSNPSRYKDPSNCPGNYIQELQTCPNHPVEQVSWNEIADLSPQNLNTFLKKLTAFKKDGCIYRLPTEAQWEYAARAGTDTQYFCGNDMSCIQNHANYYQNPLMIQGGLGSQPTDVGSFAANPWGLYDISGNVWEWVRDWYGDYPATAQVNPTGPTTGSDRGIRGGGWNGNPPCARSAYRNYSNSFIRYDYVGFRLVRTCR